MDEAEAEKEEEEMFVSKLSLITSRCLRGFPISQAIKVLSIRKRRVALLFLKTKFSVRSFALRKLLQPEVYVLCWHGRDSW